MASLMAFCGNEGEIWLSSPVIMYPIPNFSLSTWSDCWSILISSRSAVGAFTVPVKTKTVFAWPLVKSKK